jgi:hypothetical protein
VRMSVHLVARTSSVQATGVHVTGVIRVSGQTGVRCPRPLRPRCPDRAGSRTPVPRDRPRLADRVRRVAVASERLGRRCPTRAWLGRDGRTLAVRSSHEGRRHTWTAASQAHRLGRRARRLADQGSWSSARCPSVGWEHEKEQALTSSPAGASWGVAGVMLDHEAEWKVVTTLRGC